MCMFGGWGKICRVCVCTFLKLLKCEKYISVKTALVLSKTYYSVGNGYFMRSETVYVKSIQVFYKWQMTNYLESC